MSFDPYGTTPERPDDPYDPTGMTPDRTGGIARTGRSDIQSKVSIPAILLIVVGSLNILWTLSRFGEGAFALVRSPADIARQQREMEKMMGAPSGSGMTPQQTKTFGIAFNFGVGFLALIGSALSIFGGLRMYQLRSYGLAISGAVSAAIPCVSCLGCCGVGEVVGIWAIVVLMNADVKSAFQ